MIELTLGAIVAALVAKAVNRAADRTIDEGEGVLQRLVAVVRRRLTGPDEDAAALEQVEDAPDSPSRIEALAHLLDERAESAPEFRRELEALVEEARGAGVEVGTISQAAYGNQNVQNAGVSDSEINVSYGDQSSSIPRRISE